MHKNPNNLAVEKTNLELVPDYNLNSLLRRTWCRCLQVKTKMAATRFEAALTAVWRAQSCEPYKPSPKNWATNCMAFKIFIHYNFMGWVRVLWRCPNSWVGLGIRRIGRWPYWQLFGREDGISFIASSAFALDRTISFSSLKSGSRTSIKITCFPSTKVLITMPEHF